MSNVGLDEQMVKEYVRHQEQVGGYSEMPWRLPITLLVFRGALVLHKHTVSPEDVTVVIL